MNTELPAMSETEQKAIISICILAAFADGVQSEAERAQIKRVLDDFANEHLDLSTAFQEVLSGRVLLSDATQLLQSQNSRALAFEMALCVCHADEPLTSSEKEFLAALRQRLNLPDGLGNVEESARGLASEPLALPPVIGQMAPDGQDIDSSIHNSAVLAGALEIMPQSLATMAIIPVQMRMVYKIGKRYGFELDRGHIKDFLATVGIGYGAQVIEGFVSKLAGGLARRMAGRLAGGLFRPCLRAHQLASCRSGRRSSG